jgi:CheY-like chemotaxis protein
VAGCAERTQARAFPKPYAKSVNLRTAPRNLLPPDLFLEIAEKTHLLACGLLRELRMRVLIADDQKSVGTSLAELVRFCQHEVVEVVGSGLEAVHAYERHLPDVVLMDYQMPKLNGVTACRNIVAKHPDARVVLVSGSPREIAGSGALALLIKPIRLDQLYGALYRAARPPASDSDA